MATTKAYVIDSPKELWVSTDVAKKNFDSSFRLACATAVQPDEFRQMIAKTFPRTRQGVEQWIEWARSQCPEGVKIRVIMEATGSYSLELVAWIMTLAPDFEITVICPKVFKSYKGSLKLRNKTDKLDAKALACYGVERRPESSAATSELYLSLRALTRSRQAHIEMCAQTKTRLKSLDMDYLPKAVRKKLVGGYKKLINDFEKEIEKLDLEIAKLVESDEELKRQVTLLDSIPGVGFRTATAVLGEMGDLRDYHTSRQLTSYAGLDPKLKDSGETTGKSHISKEGSSRTRRTLYLSIMPSLGGTNEFKDHYDALVARGKTSMVAIVANMRKLLTLMRSLVISNTPYDRNYRNNCGKAVRKPVGKNTASTSPC